MPTCDEVFQKLRGGQQFTKLDLADAYLQLELDEESRRYTVFTTHKGLFRVNQARLRAGVRSGNLPGSHRAGVG